VKPYRQCVFQNIKISGAKNSELKYAMDTGFYGDDMYQPISNNVDVENAVNGIWHHGHTEPEDGIIYKSDLINTEYGVKIFPRMGSDWAEPGFHVWDSNIQYQKKGVWVNGARQTFFHANNFYRLLLRKHINLPWRFGRILQSGNLVTKFYNFSADNNYLINVIPEKHEHEFLISKGNKKYNK